MRLLASYTKRKINKNELKGRMFMIKLIKGDCLEQMKKLKQDKVVFDAIITDPPYNIARDNNFTSMGRAGIDFGEWDKGFDQFSWIDRTYDLLKKVVHYLYSMIGRT